MADTTEVRSDSTSAPGEPSAATVTPADAATEMATAQPADTAEKVPPLQVTHPTEAPAAIEVPVIEVPPIDRPAGVASAPDVTWMGKVRSAIANAVPHRTALMAGGLGFAAGVAFLAGSIGVMGLGHLFAAAMPADKGALRSSVADDTRALKQTMAKLEGQVAALKASIESSNRQATGQRAQIANRYEQGARTQNEMQARLSKIGDAVERMEKRVTAAVAAEATGSVPRNGTAAAGEQATAGAQPVLGAPPQVLGTLVERQVQPAPPAPPTPQKPPIVEGWAIRDVFRGRALVSSRRGIFEAAPGVNLPELGRVEAVTRQNGRWVVVTEKGIITAAARRPGPGYDFPN